MDRYIANMSDEQWALLQRFWRGGKKMDEQRPLPGARRKAPLLPRKYLEIAEATDALCNEPEEAA